MCLLWLWTLGGLRVRVDKLAGLCTCMMEAVVDSQQGTCPLPGNGRQAPMLPGVPIMACRCCKEFLFLVGGGLTSLGGVIVDQSPALLSNRAV